MTDITKFETKLNNLVNVAIDTVVDDILNDMGIKEEDDPKYVKYYEVYEDVQKHLINKWNDEIRKRLVNKKLEQVEEKVRKYLEPDYNKESGCMAFSMLEEANKADEILQRMGYVTEQFYDEGYDQVKYWKKS